MTDKTVGHRKEALAHTAGLEAFDFANWEKAAKITAETLASFRLGLDADDPYAFNKDEYLRAGHIIGRLSSCGLLASPSPIPSKAGVTQTELDVLDTLILATQDRQHEGSRFEIHLDANWREPAHSVLKKARQALASQPPATTTRDRDEALEEAAKLCDATTMVNNESAEGAKVHARTSVSIWLERAATAQELAEKIRALKHSPALSNPEPRP